MNDLARRQGAAVAQMVVHQIHRLDKIAMQRNEHGVVGRELIEAVEVLGIRHLVIAQRAARPLDQVVEAEIGARGEVRRKDGIVPAGDENRRNAMQIA